jgi:dephospho-CoA kinase
MKVIGLTGGIGSGKSYVLNMFKNLLNIPTLDLDLVARNIVNQNPEIIAQLSNTFGEDIYWSYNNEITLDRQKLAKRAFINSQQTQKLNDIVHPAVHQEANKWIENQNGEYCIIESALMIESGYYKNVDAIIGIYATQKERIQRVIKRNSCTQKEVKQRINLQIPEKLKRKYYTYIIKNEKDDNVVQQVYDINQKIVNEITNKTTV